MKKILLIVLTIILILSINVLAVDIDIGMPAINRALYWTYNYTVVARANPANESGKITSIEIWANVSLVNCKVATFYEGASNVLTTRDWELIGDVPSGSKQTFSVNLDVQTGDYIGIYFTGGRIERDTAGISDNWYKAGDQIPCTDVTFSVDTGDIISLYGTGVTVAVGIKWNGVTISKWNGVVITKWNGLE